MLLATWAPTLQKGQISGFRNSTSRGTMGIFVPEHKGMSFSALWKVKGIWCCFLWREDHTLLHSLWGQKIFVSFANSGKQSKLEATIFGLVENMPGISCFLHVCTPETCIFLLLCVPGVLVLVHALIKDQFWTMLFNLMILISTWGHCLYCIDTNNATCFNMKHN